MKILNTTRFTLCLLGLAIAGSLSAQEPPTDFPAESTEPSTCENFDWNVDMTREHPRVVDACQETVQAEGELWARLDARFVMVKDDGTVKFNVLDEHARVIDEVTIEPAPDQVAYINGRATEFEKLKSTDALNLYVPEGEYGYATQPAPKQRFVRVVPAVAVAPSAPPVIQEVDEPPQEVLVADNERVPAMLPATASLMPWAAFAGALMLFVAFSMRLGRKR